MKCPECGNEDRVLFGWVEEDRTARSPAFFERLCCYNCHWDFRGAELEIVDPLVQKYLADEEERRLNVPRLLPYKASGSNLDLSKTIALVDGHGNCLAIFDKDHLDRVLQWAEGVPELGCLNGGGMLYGDIPLNEMMTLHHASWVGRLLAAYQK